ncbi:hypothetical protein [Streptomyces sp. NPDC008001]|uniref:hypothetical protein n=1 Tax=Streptomyces sp. NPDC008001 TaxID=3364804 RepID=UPI0036EC3BE1
MHTWEIVVKRTLLTAAVASLLALAAPGLDPAPSPAEGQAAVSAAQGDRLPVLELPATTRCSTQRCSGPTDTSWGGGSAARPATSVSAAL